MIGGRNNRLLVAMVIACAVIDVFSCAAQTFAEALDATNLVWTTGGDAVWVAQSTNTHDGLDAATSGSIGSNQTSWLETTVVGPATLCFWYLPPAGLKPPSLSFTVNYDPSNNVPINVFVSSIGSMSLWGNYTCDLGDGTNVLRWSVSTPFRGSSLGFAVLDEVSIDLPRPLSFTYEPQAHTNYSGATVYFSASAIGTPPLRFQWRKDDVDIPAATNGWFNLAAAVTNDSGNYSVVVSNSQGFIVSSNALLTVLPPTAPFFYYEPESTTAYTGQTINFSGGVDGSQPFTFQWRKDSTNLSGANSSWLTLSNLSLTDAGSYTLFVTNDSGNVESSNAVLTVIQSVAPVITRQPRSLEVAEGVNTMMSVEAVGTPEPCFFWEKIEDGPPAPPPIPPLPPTPFPCHGSRRAFNNATTNDAGVYFATATNPAGEVGSREALLTVLPPMSLKGSWGQGAESVFVASGLAFLACGTNGLTILNVSNPAAPQFLSNCDTPGDASAVRVSGGLAFVADGSMGLQIISVTNHLNPVLVGGYDTPGYANDVVVRSNLAFVADGNSGLLILDVSNPAATFVVGSYSTNLGPARLALSGNLVFLTSLQPAVINGGSNYWVGGMLIVDVSDPTHPTEVGRWGNSVLSIAARNSVVFADSSVLSVTNPTQPAAIGFLNYYSTNFPPVFRVSTSAIHAAGDLLFVTGLGIDEVRLLVFDVHDPTEPIPVGCFTTAVTNGGNVGSIWVDGNYAYLSGYNMPLLIIETPFDTQPANPPQLSFAHQPNLSLNLHGRRGLHYDVEYTDALTGSPWQTLQTILLTNQNAVIQAPTNTSARFFRLKQLD